MSISDNTEPFTPHDTAATSPQAPSWPAVPVPVPEPVPQQLAPQQAMQHAMPGYPAMGQPMMGQPMMVAPKNPALALVASFFITGLGQLLNGHVGKGIAFFFGAIFAWLSLFVLIGFLLVPAVWIWSMVDAYQSAKKWNLRHGILS